VRFERREIEIDGTHVVVGVNVEHGGDAGFAAQAFDICDGARMRADKKIGQDLRVRQDFAGESFHGWRHFRLARIFVACWNRETAMLREEKFSERMETLRSPDANCRAT